MSEFVYENIKLCLSDCIDVLKSLKDKEYDLVIADPPYGINMSKSASGKFWVRRENKIWDTEVPAKNYFDEIFRVSKNQIIWGGNYFIEHLYSSRGWIFWDKGQRNFSLGDGELAWTSFDRTIKVFDFSRAKLNRDRYGFHPTEKPISLYRWIISNYSEKGDKILDPFLGSGSSAIAAYIEKRDFLGVEKDFDYFSKAKNFFYENLNQYSLDL